MPVSEDVVKCDTKLFPSKKGTGYFGTVRFDREQGQPIHMHTISGLLHANHQKPSLYYETILKTTLWLTKSITECEKQFRAAVFNVLSHNCDDDAKNFSFLMKRKALGVSHLLTISLVLMANITI